MIKSFQTNPDIPNCDITHKGSAIYLCHPWAFLSEFLSSFPRSLQPNALLNLSALSGSRYLLPPRRDQNAHLPGFTARRSGESSNSRCEWGWILPGKVCKIKGIFKCLPWDRPGRRVGGTEPSWWCGNPLLQGLPKSLSFPGLYTWTQTTWEPSAIVTPLPPYEEYALGLPCHPRPIWNTTKLTAWTAGRSPIVCSH